MAKKESIAKQITKSMFESNGKNYNDWIKQKYEEVGLALLRGGSSAYKDVIEERLCEEYAEDHIGDFMKKGATVKPHYEQKTNNFNKEEETE